VSERAFHRKPQATERPMRRRYDAISSFR